jgi:hypothetical protein
VFERLEIVPAADAALKVFDLLVAKLDGLTAFDTDHVVMVAQSVDGFVQGRPTGLQELLDQAALGQVRKRAINRRARHAFSARAEPLVELFGVEVACTAERRGKDQPSLGGVPQPALSEIEAKLAFCASDPVGCPDPAPFVAIETHSQ